MRPNNRKREKRPNAGSSGIPKELGQAAGSASARASGLPEMARQWEGVSRLRRRTIPLGAWKINLRK
jgi:hypothetical protein